MNSNEDLQRPMQDLKLMDKNGSKIWIESDMIYIHYHGTKCPKMRYGQVYRDKKGDVVWVELFVRERVFRIGKERKVYVPRWVLTLPDHIKIMVTSFTRRWACTVGVIRAHGKMKWNSKVGCAGFLRNRIFIPMNVGKHHYRMKKNRINPLTRWSK